MDRRTVAAPQAPGLRPIVPAPCPRCGDPPGALPSVATSLAPRVRRCARCGTRSVAGPGPARLVFECAECGLPFASTELLPHSAHRCDDCRGGKVPADLPDEQLAAAIEREMRAVLDRQWRFVGTPALTAYLEAVARQVAATVEGAPSTVSVVLLEEAGLKTLALPSGTLVLSLGTLLFLEDEAELAFVLAHELTHAACADAATRIVRLGFDALAKDGGESADSGFHRAADDLIALGYGRHRERDADGRGLEAVLALGYDPDSVLRYLRRLQQMVDRGDPRAAEIALAHPTAADRARRLDRALFGRTMPQPGRVNREVFRRAAGHAVLTTRLERVRGFGEPLPETAAPSARRARRVLAWVLAAAGVLLAAVAWWLAR